MPDTSVTKAEAMDLLKMYHKDGRLTYIAPSILEFKTITRMSEFGPRAEEKLLKECSIALGSSSILMVGYGGYTASMAWTHALEQNLREAEIALKPVAAGRTAEV